MSKLKERTEGMFLEVETNNNEMLWTVGLYILQNSFFVKSVKGTLKGFLMFF